MRGSKGAFVRAKDLTHQTIAISMTKSRSQSLERTPLKQFGVSIRSEDASVFPTGRTEGAHFVNDLEYSDADSQRFSPEQRLQKPELGLLTIPPQRLAIIFPSL
jgi:hypothetical protein